MRQSKALALKSGLALAILLFAATSALAFGEIRYVDRPMNLRDGRSLEAGVAGSLQAGQKVRVGSVKNGWAAVFEPHETRESEDAAVGYVKLKYLKKNPGAAIFKAWGRKVEAKRAITVYSGPSASSGKAAALAAGEVVLMVSGKNGWAMVFPPNATIRSSMGAIGYAESSGFQRAIGKTTAPIIRTVPAASAPAESISAESVLSAGIKPGARKKTAQSGQRQVVTIDKSMFGGKRPDPTPNKIAHGFKYRVLEKADVSKTGEKWVTLKVFVAISKLPKLADLNDFTATLWKEHRRKGQPLAVLLYVPGMNTNDLSYGVFKFDDEGFDESWVRRTTLYGTKFDKQK